MFNKILKNYLRGIITLDEASMSFRTAISDIYNSGHIDAKECLAYFYVIEQWIKDPIGERDLIEMMAISLGEEVA